MGDPPLLRADLSAGAGRAREGRASSSPRRAERQLADPPDPANAGRIAAGSLAQALGRQQVAGAQLASTLKRARVDLVLTDAQARAEGDALARLEGLEPAALQALHGAGLTDEALRRLFATAAGVARGGSVTRLITRREPDAALRQHYRSMTVADVAALESALFNAHLVARTVHATLTRHLATAGDPRKRARAMRSVAADARRVKAEAGSLLRTAARGVGG